MKILKEIFQFFTNNIESALRKTLIYTMASLHLTAKPPSKVSLSLYGHDDVKVSWSAASYAKGYYVYYKKSTDSAYTYAGRTNISGESGYQISQSTSKTATKVVSTYSTKSGTSNKTYYYKVRAYKTVGSTKIYGPWSSVTSYKLK